MILLHNENYNTISHKSGLNSNMFHCWIKNDIHYGQDEEAKTYNQHCVCGYDNSIWQHLYS